MRRILYEIQHRTVYRYVGSVSVSHLQMHLMPRTLPRQEPLACSLILEPAPSVVEVHQDYFGNRTHFITVDRAHTELVILSHSRVTIGPAFIPDPSETPPWEMVRARCRSDHSGQALEAHEFTYPSPLVPTGPAYAAFAADSFTRGRPVLDAVVDLTRRIFTGFKFDPNATQISTPVSEVLEKKRGVCQDFAQLQIACLRSMGIPARYVSGYLETDPPPGQTKLRGVDASHAWVSFYCPGLGWIDTDPTNNCFPSLRHVTVGWGRDYGDVSPIRGVLMGGSGQRMQVSVDVAAIDPPPA